MNPIEKEHFIGWLKTFVEMYRDAAERKPHETRQRLPLYNNFPPVIKVLGPCDGKYCAAIICKRAREDQEDVEIDEHWGFHNAEVLKVNLDSMVDELKLTGDFLGVLEFNWREFGQKPPVGDFVEDYIQQEMIRSVERVVGLVVEGGIERRDFEFISSEELRQVLRADYEEAQLAFGANAYKAAAILCGGLIEGMLLDALDRPEVMAKREFNEFFKTGPPNWDEVGLAKLINAAHSVGILEAEAVTLSRAVKDFRDTVHPRAEIRTHLRAGREEAKILLEIVNLVYRDLEKALGLRRST